MKKRYSTATGNAVLRAYNKATKIVIKERLLATSQSGGFIMPKGWPKGEGYQVFVRIVRFSEGHLKAEPLTGGLYSTP